MFKSTTGVLLLSVLILYAKNTLLILYAKSALFEVKRGPLKTSVSKKTARTDDISHVNLIVACVG